MTHEGNIENQPTAKFLATTSYKRLALYAIITITILIAVTVSIVVFLNMGSKNDDYFLNTPTGSNTEDPPLGSHKIYSKQVWGGKPSLNLTKPLRHPTEYVLISHTAGKVCKELNDCSSVMQAIQSYHLSILKSPDIGYNFVIGGDANIYVGRGWDIQNFHRDNNVGISFTGNYILDLLTPEMISALKELLELGVKLEKISPNYKLVCHNQTFPTLSPGNHVYEEISKFPNFYDGPITI